MYNTFKSEKGITLIEILAVIIIIGLLATFLMPKLNSFTKNSQVTIVETDIRLLKSNIQEHFVDDPTKALNADLLKKSFGTPVTLVSAAGADPAYYTLPEKKDPWGNPYEVIVGKKELFVAFHSFGPNQTDDINKSLSATSIKDDIFAIFYPKP
ncbi:prepilin-type N-terminal cleavage/methylation domain-containing protein [Bacillus thuringiensis]|uniref:prepilin-type N-terminal cleavage/methylation domain-containing protein n=1 Tax=Bacillus thuringiensis TaxID=1428 RepID=UPI0021D6697A|nr:prepilin-type N-terminal cleavage/methylation domain-containing protein [Bacillus thuringiensis]MCU7668036.1 prepilin-type N-terminal cleavage/methylation domain-containing protein [Bacillus thuringiensis]